MSDLYDIKSKNVKNSIDYGQKEQKNKPRGEKKSARKTGETKQKIMITALKLFAEKGYEATSVSDIAERLDLTKSALYKHYKNKRDIFNEIILRAEKNDFDRAAAFSMPESELSESAESEKAYKSVEIANLIEFSKGQLDYWINDPFASDFKKILMHERFSNKNAAALFEQYLASGPLCYVADIFKKIGIKKPELAAFEFYAPMFFAYFSDGQRCESAEEKGETKNAESAVNGLIAAHFENQLNKLNQEKTVSRR